MRLLAGKVRAVGAAVEMPLQAVWLLQGQVREESAVRVDREAVDVGRVHSRGVFPSHGFTCYYVCVVEPCQQVLAETPGEDRVQGGVGQRKRGSDQESHPVPVRPAQESVGQVHQPAEVILRGPKCACGQLIRVGHGREPNRRQATIDISVNRRRRG